MLCGSFKMTSMSPVTSSKESYLPTTKVRNLKPKDRGQLVLILNVNNSWLELASVIPHPKNESTCLFSANDINCLQSCFAPFNSPAEAFLEHWSRTGEDQPTLSDLLKLLEEAKQLRAANYVSENLLRVPRCSHEDVDISTKDFEQLLGDSNSVNNFSMKFPEKNNGCFLNRFQDKSQGLPSIEESVDLTIKAQSPIAGHHHDVQNNDGASAAPSFSKCNSSEVFQYRYQDLALVTQNFDNKRVLQGGCKVGEGAFGTVYRGYIRHQWIAVKKLKGVVDRQFLTELEVLTRYKHENLLPLLGYSNDGPFACLVYAYMSNGSLQERLACVGSVNPLSWKARIAIACGTARGINHLHTFGDVPLVHRDIKSANVLLDENMAPKIGDFGLARIGSTNNTTTVAVTANVFGTSVYMAKEALQGDVSGKLDTFSYGVVLFELLTGLPPYDASREERDLISFMEENCEDIIDLLDTKAGSWDTNVATLLYDLANLCVESRKKKRPTMTQVLEDVEKLYAECQ